MNFVKSPELAEKLSAHHRIDHPVDDIILAVRPEELTRDGGDLQLSAHCVAAEGLGSETLCHLQLDLPGRGIASTDFTALGEASGTITAKWVGDHTDLAEADITVGIPAATTLLYSQKTQALLNPAGT